MTGFQIAQLLAGILSASGTAVMLEQLIDLIRKVRRGQKLREPERGVQIVQTRDAALAEAIQQRARAERAEAAHERERTLRQAWEDAWHELRRFCVDHGTPLATIPAPPPETRPLPTL